MAVYLPDHMGSDVSGKASDLAPVTELPDPADMASWKYCCPGLGDYDD